VRVFKIIITLVTLVALSGAEGCQDQGGRGGAGPAPRIPNPNPDHGPGAPPPGVPNPQADPKGTHYTVILIWTPSPREVSVTIKQGFGGVVPAPEKVFGTSLARSIESDNPNLFISAKLSQAPRTGRWELTCTIKKNGERAGPNAFKYLTEKTDVSKVNFVLCST
jgi:hypothetical protein